MNHKQVLHHVSRKRLKFIINKV